MYSGGKYQELNIGLYSSLVHVKISFFRSNLNHVVKWQKNKATKVYSDCQFKNFQNPMLFLIRPLYPDYINETESNLLYS